MITFEITPIKGDEVFCEVKAKNVRREMVAGVVKLCEVIDAIGVETAKSIRAPSDFDRGAEVTNIVPIEGGYEAYMWDGYGPASRQTVRVFRDGTVEIVDLCYRMKGKLFNYLFPVFECGLLAFNFLGPNSGIHRALSVNLFHALRAAEKNGGKCTAVRIEVGSTIYGFPIEMPGEIVRWE